MIKRMRDIIFSSSHIIGSRLIGHFLAVHAEVDEDHALPESTSFNDVLTLYTFDRELRLPVLDAIERVEVALRARWAYHMAMNHGPHGYLEQRHYGHIPQHARAVADLTKEFGRSRDIFAVHYREKYTSPKLPLLGWQAKPCLSACFRNFMAI